MKLNAIRQLVLGGLITSCGFGNLKPSGGKTLSDAQSGASSVSSDAAGTVSANSGASSSTTGASCDKSAGTDFQTSIEQALSTNCVSCHKTGGQSPDLSTFANAVASGEALASAVSSGLMPPGGGTAQLKAQIAAWSDANFAATGPASATASCTATAADTATSPPTSPAPGPTASTGTSTNVSCTTQSGGSAPTYYGDVQPMVNQYCGSCHNGVVPPNLFDYATAVSYASAAEGAIAGTTTPSMPPSGNPAPASTDLTMLRTWIANGEPEGTPCSGASTPPPPPPPTGPGLITAYCSSCHSQLSTSTGQIACASKIKEVVQDKSMPRGTTLTSDQITLIETWAGSQTSPAGSRCNIDD